MDERDVGQESVLGPPGKKPRRARRACCWAIAALVGIPACWLYVVWPRDPAQLLPAGRCNGVIVFHPDSDSWLSRAAKGHPLQETSRTLATIDMGSFATKWLPDSSGGIEGIDPKGRWLLTNWKDGVTVVTREGARRLQLPVQASSIRRRAGAMSSDGFLVYMAPTSSPPWEAFRVTRVDLGSGKVETGKATPACFDVIFGRTSNEFYGAMDGRILHLDLHEEPTTVFNDGRSPAVSADGRLAFVTRNRRAIMVSDSPGGRLRHINGPGVWLTGLRWSPDGRFLAYTYSLGLARYMWVASDTHGLGVVDVTTGEHFRVLPRPEAKAAGIVAAAGADGFLWVDRIDPVLIRRLGELAGRDGAKPQAAKRLSPAARER